VTIVPEMEDDRRVSIILTCERATVGLTGRASVGGPIRAPGVGLEARAEAVAPAAALWRRRVGRRRVADEDKGGFDELILVVAVTVAVSMTVAVAVAVVAGGDVGRRHGECGRKEQGREEEVRQHGWRWVGGRAVGDG
jgi:hypothetical protein